MEGTFKDLVPGAITTRWMAEERKRKMDVEPYAAPGWHQNQPVYTSALVFSPSPKRAGYSGYTRSGSA